MTLGGIWNLDTLGSKRLLDVVLVLGEHLVDLVIKMELDRLAVLFDLHTQKRLEAAHPVILKSLEYFLRNSSLS
jgi:hypothetical protein